jgi:TolB protein
MPRAIRLAALISVALILVGLPAGAVDTKTRRMSVKSNGDEVAEGSDGYIDGLSDDGKLAAFATDGAFVAADDNGLDDVYLRNLRTGMTRWVSVDGDGQSDGPAVSGNGHFVVFTSEANNLAPHNGNGDEDVYIYNVKTKNIQLVSRGANGVDSQPAVNYSGRFVAFTTETQLVNKDNNLVEDVYLRDRKEGKTTLISVNSQGGDVDDGESDDPTISASGRFVAFSSGADDLIANDGNTSIDVFVRDRAAGKTRRVSIKSNGTEKSGTSDNPTISADGTFVVFESIAKLEGTDDNGVTDLYIRNRNSQTTKLITHDLNGDPTDAESYYPALSPNGRLIGFYSFATDLIANDPDGDYSAYVFDRKRNKLLMVDRDNSGAPGDGESYVTGISNRFVLFSTDSALAGNDANGVDDVYRRGPLY